MKEIKLYNNWLKIQYFVAWIGFILTWIMVWPPILALILANYGKNTDHNQSNKEGILNKTYQKFILFWGGFWGDLFIISIIVNLLVRGL